MPAVKITQKPIGTPGDDTHFIVTQPELPEGYTPTGQETEEELEELKVESVREIEMDAMVALIQEKLDMDETPTEDSAKPITSGGVKAALDEMDEDISSLNEDITNLTTATNGKAPGIYETASGSVASFADGADNLPLKSCVVSIEPIQEGTGDPSLENVRPISGRTGVNLWRTKRNLLPSEDGSYKTLSSSSIYFPDSPVWLPTGTYYIGVYRKTGEEASAGIYLKIDNGSYNRIESNISIQFGVRSFTLTTGAFVTFRLYSSNPVGAEYRFILTNSLLTSGVDEFAPYQGNSYSVNWETEVGTMYGGTFDVVSGKLTVDSGYIASYNGESLPSTWISDRDVYAEGTMPTTGAEVVYQLSEPVVYLLTPQEVTTLLGDNNIWADSGDILELEYVADTKLYIGESQSGTLGTGRQSITKPEIQPISETVKDVTEAEEKEIQEETDDERGE